MIIERVRRTNPRANPAIANERTDVLMYEFKTDLKKYLTVRGAKYKTLEDLIKFLFAECCTRTSAISAERITVHR